MGLGTCCDEPAADLRRALGRAPAAVLSVYGQRARGGERGGGDGGGGGGVHGPARRDLRWSHAVNDVVPGRRRGRARGPAARGRLLRVLRPGSGDHRGRRGAGRSGAPGTALGGDRGGGGGRAGGGLPAPEPLRRRSGEPRVAAVRLDPGRDARGGADARARGAGRNGVPGGGGATTVLRLGGRAARPREPGPRTSARGGLSARAGAGGGGDRSDHGCAARVRAARGAGGDRARTDAADRREPRAERADRAADRVGGAGPFVLHQLLAGVLLDDARDRPVRARAGGAEPPGPLMPFSGFLGNALLAGSCIALLSGLIGWFVVLRGQVFAADALSRVAFTGALAAAAAGLDLRVGLFAATVLVALLLGVLGERARSDDVTIGIVFVWTLGLGVLFLDLFNSGAAGANGTIAAGTLFGSIFGLTAGEARAAARVPVRALGLPFPVLLGLDAAEATQAVGALLLLGLLAAPAGAAHRLTANPYRGMALAMAIALLSTWIGLALSYWISGIPPGSAVIGVAVAFYALTIAI